jgi:hypothetical protein
MGNQVLRMRNSQTLDKPAPKTGLEKDRAKQQLPSKKRDKSIESASIQLTSFIIAKVPRAHTCTSWRGSVDACESILGRGSRIEVWPHHVSSHGPSHALAWTSHVPPMTWLMFNRVGCSRQKLKINQWSIRLWIKIGLMEAFNPQINPVWVDGLVQQIALWRLDPHPMCNFWWRWKDWTPQVGRNFERVWNRSNYIEVW